MSWSRLDNGQNHCARHDTTWGELESCPYCHADPGPPLVATTDEAIAPPRGCQTGEEHERRFTELADYAEELARDVAGGEMLLEFEPSSKRRKAKDAAPTFLSEPNPALAAKLIDAAIKARRAAGDYTREREDNVRVARLEALKRAMAGKGHTH